MKALNRLDNTPDWVLMNFASNAVSRDVALEALNRLVAQEKVHGPRHLLNRVVTLGKMLHGDSSRGHYDVRMKIADIINDLYPELR
jgi:hypothetical protein